MADDAKTQLGPAPQADSQAVTQAVSPAAPQTSYSKPSIDPLLGTTVAGRYVIEKKLGEGGMGAVYLAKHNVLEKDVALKILHGELGRKPELVERFMQEAKAASRIRHENVIDISDFGATADGLVFFAMELLDGHDLHAEIARAKKAGELLPWERTKKIFLQICAALSAAHARGVVHRDLKPENVYLVPFLDDPDFVKLLDFGIAKLTDTGEGSGDRKLTKTGMLFGTPEYMSPEQARGEQADHRVDIYAMGCILFQLVTSRVPFEADNFMGVLAMHLTATPPVIAPETFDHIGAPRELALVIDRALDKDRDRRYQTIDELATAVRVVCGDVAPASGRSQRPTNVPAPIAITREPSTRVRTQWVGNISVPEEAVEPAPKPRSKLPLVAGVAVVALTGGAAAFALLGKHGEPATATATTAAAQPAVPQPAVPQPAVLQPAAPIPQPAAPAQPALLPAVVTMQLDSTPHGATVTDTATGHVIGKTPCTFTAPGSRQARQLAFQLHGYAIAAVELPVDGTMTRYSQPLAKPGAKQPAVAATPSTPAEPAAAGTPVTHPDSSGPVTSPDATAEPAKPAEPVAKPAEPVAKPADPAKPTDSDAPQLKSFDNK